MELLAKLADAGSMFWSALDERERLILLYAGAWLLLALFAHVQRLERDSLKRELLEELAERGDRSPD